jgi:glycosyltransferase involved in cell wall biosynthesis
VVCRLANLGVHSNYLVSGVCVKTKILYLVTQSEFGGAQNYVYSLATSLPREIYQVRVACGTGGPLIAQLQGAGVEVIPLPGLVRNINPIRDVWAFATLLQLVNGWNPCIVHTNSTKAGLLGRIAARLSGTPVVFTAHGWAFSEGVPKAQRIMALWTERLAARFSNQIICVSEYDYGLALRNRVASPRQMSIIHNGVADVPAHLLADVASPHQVRIVMVGRFAPQKGQADLVRAVATVRGDFELCFVGDGQLLGQVEDMSRKLNLLNKVKFLGAREDVAEILAHCHIGVLISNWEGLPLSVLEMMRAGLPIVATHTGGIPELVIDGVNGYLVPHNNPGAIANALQCLAENGDLRRQFGIASRERFLQEFTLSQMLRDVQSVYERLLWRN